MKKINSLRRLLLLSVFFTYAGMIINLNAQHGWEQMTSMNIPKGGSQSCVIDSMIYVFGGSGIVSGKLVALNSAEVYNTKTNDWSELENMPEGLWDHVGGIIKNKIYIATGWEHNESGWVTSNNTYEFDPVGNSWVAKKDCPYYMGTSFSCVSNDSLLYVFGGGDWPEYDSLGGKQGLVYNPSLDKWDSIPDMLYSRSGGGNACILDNKIYVFGGGYTYSSNKFHIHGKTEMYDPNEKTWTELANMPIPVVDHISLVYNDKVLVFGGDTAWISSSKSYGCNIIQEFDPSSNRWRIMQGMPFNRTNMTGEIAGDSVYLIGGYSSSRDLLNPLSEVWRFNLDSLQEGCEEISIIEPSENFTIGDEVRLYVDILPLDFAKKTILWSSDNESVVTVIDSMNGIFRCESEGTATITAKLKYGGCFDSYTLTVNGPAWMQMTSMNIPKGGSQSCVIDSMIYVFGGLDKDIESLSSAEVYNTKTNSWSDLTPVPVDLYSTSAGVINDTIYLAGGWRREGGWFTIDSTFAYYPETDSWEAKEECPKNAAGHAWCVLNGRLYLFGGISSTDTDTSAQKQALVYDPATDTWDALPDMSYARTFESRACVYDGQIYVFGGVDYNWNNIEKVEKYDPVENTWTELADMPVPVLNHLCLVYKDKIYLFGGDSLWTRSPDQTYCTNIIQEYDPLTNQWQIMKNMPFNRSMMTGQKVGNFVYIIGGYPYNTRDFPSVLSEVWRFNLDSLKVRVVLCDKVLISQYSLTMEVDDTHTLSAGVLPAYATDKTISWSSSNPEVATVSSEGEVTAVSGGEAIITATANGGGCTAFCSVSVSVGIINSRADQISVFPNPVIDLLNIQTGLSEGQVIEISSLNGQIVYSLTTDRPTCQLDLSSFQEGVYFITIRSKDLVKTKKIIKM
jgi:N-acetylneuraminic acid mutarotase